MPEYGGNHRQAEDRRDLNRRRVSSQGNQHGHISAPGNYEVGAIQVLAADGKWKFNPIDRDDPRLGNGRAWARVHHFRGNNGPATRGCLPHPIRVAMVTFGPDEARLTEERADIPASWKEDPDTYD
jgi:hypothetical protein